MKKIKCSDERRNIEKQETEVRTCINRLKSGN